MCKVEIQWLKVFNHEGEFQEKVKIEKPVKNEEMSDWVLDLAENCYVCRGSDNDELLLVCDQCNYNLCHTYCCGLSGIPENEWYCSECIEERRERERRQRDMR